MPLPPPPPPPPPHRLSRPPLPGHLVSASRFNQQPSQQQQQPSQQPQQAQSSSIQTQQPYQQQTQQQQTQQQQTQQFNHSTPQRIYDGNSSSGLNHQQHQQQLQPSASASFASMSTPVRAPLPLPPSAATATPTALRNPPPPFTPQTSWNQPSVSWTTANVSYNGVPASSSLPSSTPPFNSITTPIKALPPNNGAALSQSVTLSSSAAAAAAAIPTTPFHARPPPPPSPAIRQPPHHVGAPYSNASTATAMTTETATASTVQNGFANHHPSWPPSSQQNQQQVQQQQNHQPPPPPSPYQSRATTATPTFGVGARRPPPPPLPSQQQHQQQPYPATNNNSIATQPTYNNNNNNNAQPPPSSSSQSSGYHYQPPVSRYSPMRTTAVTSSVPLGPPPPFPAASSGLQPPPASPYPSSTPMTHQQQPPSTPFHLHPPPIPSSSLGGQPPFPPSLPANQQQRQQPPFASGPPPPPPPEQQQQIQSPRPKIDPAQIPRPPLFTRPQNAQPLPMYAPKSSILSFQDLSTVKFPPPADSRFVVKDDGNASPHLIRSIFHAIPTNRSVLRQVTQHADMFGILCTPAALPSASMKHRPRAWPPSSSSLPQRSLFPVQADDPQSIPLCTNASASIDDDSTNPPRCSHCQAYANPFFAATKSSTDSSTMFCNFCQYSVDRSVSERISWFHGALEYGTVEYPVSGDYITRPSVAPPILLYAIDLTCPHVAEYGAILMQVGLEIAEHYARQEEEAFHDEQHHHQAQQQQQHYDGSSSSSRRRRRKERMHRAADQASSSSIPSRPLPRMGICLVSATGISILKLEDSSQPPSWTVMSDLTEEPFCPLPVSEWTWELTPKPADDDNDNDDPTDEEGTHWTDLFKVTWEHVIDSLEGWLNQKTAYAEQLKVYQATCGGAAMAMLVDALQETGGRATWLSWRRCNFGVGSLRDRERDMKVHECDLYTPLQGKKLRMQKPEQVASQFYQRLGEQCAKHQIVMDVVFHTNPHLPRSFLDVGTMTELCRMSTGRLSWITTTSGTPWEETLLEELCQNAVSCCGYDAIFKVRCSTGLEVKSFIASSPGVIVDRGMVVSSPEVELASVSPQTCIAVLLEHRVGGLPKQRGSSAPPCVYIQTALLYTNILGHRRLRISTLALRTTSNAVDIFRSVDFGAATALLMRHTVARLRKEPEEEGKDVRRAESRRELMDRCVDLLANYRLNTTAKSAPLGQLILPDKLQLLPLFVMSLIKGPILRPSIRSGQSGMSQPDPTGDERALAMYYGAMSTPAMAMLLVHANIFPLSKLKDGAGDWQIPAGAEYTKSSLHLAAHHPYVQLPASVHPSISCLDEDEIYVMDNGLQIFLHVGRGTAAIVKDALLSSDDNNGKRPPHFKTISTTSLLGQQVHRLIWQMRLFSSPAVATESQSMRLCWPPVIIVESKEESGGASRASLRWEESKVLSLMVDDATGHEKDYVDFLCELHRLIKLKFDQDGK